MSTNDDLNKKSDNINWNLENSQKILTLEMSQNTIVRYYLNMSHSKEFTGLATL